MANIMIIDDKPYMAFLISDSLRQSGHSAECYEDDWTAMEEIDDHRPDIVLFDIYYRGFEGWGILHKLKSRYPDLPVIILSAYGNFLSDPRLEEADGFVMKSISTGELNDKINEVLVMERSM